VPRLTLHARLSPLAERPYRLLFSATTISTLGDSVANIALAFAVLDLTEEPKPIYLGIIFAGRQAANAALVLFGGVLSDRLPRNRILVAAAIGQGAAQAATAAVVLSGHATLGLLIALQIVYGAADGFVIPAETGLIPQTVSPVHLQEANALRGAAALLLARIRVPVRIAVEQSRFFHELREGWREFTSRTWLWSTVVIFGLGNFFFMFWPVLGPTYAKEDLGGAGHWAVILAVNGIGAVLGGVFALRYRPRLPLVACVIWPMLFCGQLVALALGASTWVLAAASFFAGAAIAIHVALWFTIFQREVPEHAQSRVSSYDTLGSFVLTPLGFVAAGFVGGAIGLSSAAWFAVGAILVLSSIMLLIPSVWRVGRTPEATTLPA
jgi:MFS family permease